MMNWDKCVDVIHRLSSRINNEQNPSAMIPSCIEKSFYQCKSNPGQEYCVEVCGTCSDPTKISDGFVKNNNWESPTKINQQFRNPIDLNRHQFALSKMFDNKRRYIDYVVANVLRQVVNHISLESLHQLSCYLPQHIEEILRDVTDMDSDRLVRILVTEVLQSYGTNAGQVTDWYEFANSIKPVLPPSMVKDDDKKKANDTGNKIPSKSKKLAKDKKGSDRILSNDIKSIIVKKKQSSESIASSKVITPATDSNIPSVNRTPSTVVTPQIMSTKTSMTPRSTQSKETYTPIGAKYQPKTEGDQNSVFDKTAEISHHESLPFHEISTDVHHNDHKSKKSSDRSSSSDCILTIHHKHKHKRGSHHHHHRKHHTTTSFDSPSSRSLSSHTSIPINELVPKYEQTSVDASPIVTDTAPTRIQSRQNISFNSINTEQLRSSDLATDEQLFLFKLLTSPDIENPITDDNQSPSSNDLTKLILPSSENRVHPNINSIPLGKKILRINHYPNMLADFD